MPVQLFFDAETMEKERPRFSVGDIVINTRKNPHGKYHWDCGVVAMIVPAGVIPLALFNRHLKKYGDCRMSSAKEPMMHKERYIICVNRNGRNNFYCPHTMLLGLSKSKGST